MKSRLALVSFVVSVAAVPLGLAACAAASGESDRGEPSAEPASDPAERELAYQAKKARFERLLETVRGDLFLTPETDAKIVGLVERLRESRRATKDTYREFLLELSDAASDGEFSPTELAEARAALAARAAERGDEAERALQSLHALLDEDQRVALVTTLQGNVEIMSTARRGWDRAHSGDPRQRTRRVRHLADKLHLTAEQRARFEAALVALDDSEVAPSEDQEAAEEHDFDEDVGGALRAFVADDFDASTLALDGRFRDFAERRIARHLAHFQVLFDVLDDEQRSELAEIVAARADRF
jgi:Spy/CpxP family protein refolding chaperone